MSACKYWLPRLFPVAAGARKSGRSRRARLAMEELEGRLLPTVVFLPQLGAEQQDAGNGDQLSSQTVQLVYWGPSSIWNGATMPQYTAAAGKLLASGYLNAVTQYGSDGKAWLASSPITDTDPLPSTMDESAVQDEMDRLQSQGRIPSGQPITSVFVTPPNVKHDGTWVGKNWVDDGRSLVLDTYTGSVNPDGTLAPNVDNFTWTLGHELAEAMSSPDNNGVLVYPGENYHTDDHSGQIGDFEPNSYNMRTANGVEVQPVWSRAGGNFIVADNTSLEQCDVTPVYDSFNNFVGRYFLDVYGDRGPSKDDVIAVTSNAFGGVSISLNGEMIQFDQGQVPVVHLYLGNGNDVVNVEGLPKEVSLLINKDGTGVDDVNLSPTAGNLSTIQGHVFIDKALALFCYDEDGTANQSYALDANSPNTDDPLEFTHSDGGPVYFQSTIPNVVLYAASRSTSIDVAPLGVANNLSIYGADSNATLVVDDLANRVAVANYTVSPTQVTLTKEDQSVLYTVNYTAVKAMSLSTPLGSTVGVDESTHALSVAPVPRWGHGSLTIDGAGVSDLTVDDSDKTSGKHTYTLTAGGLSGTGEAGAFLPLNYAHLNSLKLMTGSTATVNVDATPAPTSVLKGTGGTTTFNVGFDSHNLDGLSGPLTLDGVSGGATATVNDSSHVPGLVPTTYTVHSGDISRTDEYWMKVNGQWKIVPVTQTINFSHLSQISLQASDQGQNVVNVESTSIPTNVYSGAGTDQVNVTPSSRNLDAIAGALSVSGAPLVVNDQAGAGHSPWGATPVSYLVAANFSRTVKRVPWLPPAVTTIQYSGVNLTLNTSSGPNVVTVTSAGATTINSGAADAITVSSDALLEGHVIVNAHGGTLTLDDRGLENDEGDLSTDVFTSGYALTDQGIHHSEREWSRYYVDGSDLPGGKGKWVTTITNWAAAIDYTNLARLTIDGPAVDTSYGVASTATGAAVVINGQTGDKPWQPHDPDRSTWNHFTLGGLTVKNIRGPVTLNGSGAADTMLVDDSAATAQDIVTITAAQVGTAARDQFFASGGGLTYSNVPALTLNLSNAYDDVVNLKPSSGTAFTINGSQAAFQAGHGALLDLDLTDVTNPVNTPDKPGAGKWTFGNRQTVTYSGVARTASANR
jgi:hypothetical protein